MSGYKIDPKRDDHFFYGPTNVFVRAEDPDGRFVSADISTLDRESLLAWLQTLDEAGRLRLILHLFGFEAS